MFEKKSPRRDDFRNRLIWGDNKLVMASLMQEFKGKVDLIYIDPPFDVGADFTMDVPIGDEDETVAKDQSTLELVAYRDTWGRGIDSYYSMIFERLVLMRELLSDRGAIFVHCDWHVNHGLRSILEDVFAADHFMNEITWRRKGGVALGTMSRLSVATDTIFWLAKSNSYTLNPVFEPAPDEYIQTMFKNQEADGRRFMLNVMRSPHPRANLMYDYKGYKMPPNGWAIPLETMKRLDSEGRLYFASSKERQIYKKIYLDQYPGQQINNLWTDIPTLKGTSQEIQNFATQKPEALLSRILRLASNEGDLVADLFCGSGTTVATAEKLGRRWLMADLGRFGIHTSRKRVIELQRTLHADGKPYRAFDVYNLGRYERQWWQKERLKGADEEHRRVVPEFFKAEQLSKAPSPLIHGRKNGAFVHVDGIDSIFTRVEAISLALAVAAAAGGTECYALAWEFEMDLRLTLSELEQQPGVKIKPVLISGEIMEKNLRTPPPFFEMVVVEAEPVLRKSSDGRSVDIKLTRFLPSLAEVPSKELEAIRERAIRSGMDFIDFWAMDFVDFWAIDFDWKPGKPFNHHWQDYRTWKDRSLKTVSDAGHVYPKRGKYTACVKVVDTFGSDTSITVAVEV